MSLHPSPRSSSARAVTLFAAFTLAAGLFVATRAAAFSSGPPDGYAGDPPDFRTCTTCHGGGKPGDGSLELLNVPLQYDPNQSYILTVELGDPGQARWGFELTALDDMTLAQAGILTLIDSTTTQLSDNPKTMPDYLKQTSEGTFAGTQNGPVSWSFQWTAPPSGSVTFYVAGNAANNNNFPDEGDVIYATQVPIVPPAAGIDPIGSPVAVTGFEPSYPNPFRPATTIPFTLARPGWVSLAVYGADGRLVTRLIDGERPAGRQVVRWDGRDGSARRLPSGVYFLTLSANGVESRERVVLAE